MKHWKFSESQIVAILKEGQAGISVAKICGRRRYCIVQPAVIAL